MNVTAYFILVYNECSISKFDEIIKFMMPVDLLSIEASSEDDDTRQIVRQTAIKLLKQNLSCLFSLLYTENNHLMDCLIPGASFVSGSVLLQALLGERYLAPNNNNKPDYDVDVFISQENAPAFFSAINERLRPIYIRSRSQQDRKYHSSEYNAWIDRRSSQGKKANFSVVSASVGSGDFDFERAQGYGKPHWTGFTPSCTVKWMNEENQKDIEELLIPADWSLDKNFQVIVCEDPIAVVDEFDLSLLRNTFDGKTLVVFDLDALRQRKLRLGQADVEVLMSDKPDYSQLGWHRKSDIDYRRLKLEERIEKYISRGFVADF